MQPKSPEVFSVSPEILSAERIRRIILREALPLTAKSIAVSIRKLEDVEVLAADIKSKVGALSSSSAVNLEAPHLSISRDNAKQLDTGSIDLSQLGYRPDSDTSFTSDSDSTPYQSNLMAA